MSDISWMEQCDSTKVLLLEGRQDCNIIKEFCKNNNINENSFDYCYCAGYDGVLHKLTDILKMSPYNKPKIIGIIVDADIGMAVHYEEIKGKVKEFYKLPVKMPKGGLIHSDNQQPKLGIWIMPNNQDNGALEEFYLQLATDIDTKFIDDAIKQAEKKKLTSFKSQHRKKAIMHTYFAWRDEPDDPLHSAINKIALDNNKDIAKAFKSWLKDLF